MMNISNYLVEKGFIDPRGIPAKKIALPNSKATAHIARLLVLLKPPEAINCLYYKLHE